MRFLPFIKPKGCVQFAGAGFDSSGGGGGGGGAHLPDYTTDETDTGQKWVDGKPIYMKTLVFTDGNFAGGGSRNHNITNLDYVVDFNIRVQIDNNRYINDISNGRLKIWYIDNSYVHFIGSGDSVSPSTIKPLTITIWYTKTS